MSPQDAGNRNASAPDVREAAEALLAAWDKAPACGPIPEGIINGVIALRAALAAPVSPPRKRRGGGK